MLDIMPAPRLIFQQWEKHGTCSGLSPNAYFETVRKVRAIVKIPAEFMQLTEMLTVSPDEVEEAFVKANPGLSRDAVAVTCDSRRLSECASASAGTFTFTAVPTSMSTACRRRWSCRRCAKGPLLWRAKHARKRRPFAPGRNQFATRRQRAAVRRVRLGIIGCADCAVTRLSGNSLSGLRPMCA